MQFTTGLTTCLALFATKVVSLAINSPTELNTTAPAVPSTAPLTNSTLGDDVQVMESGFAATCRELNMHNMYYTLLYARCTMRDGSLRSGHIDLNNCLQNNCGGLTGAR
jgi:hypothetical protein